MASKQKPTKKPVSQLINAASRVVVKKTREEDLVDGAFDLHARRVLEGFSVPVIRY